MFAAALGIAFTVVLLAVVAAVVWRGYFRPLATARALSRLALRRAGMRQHLATTPAGRLSWWTGGSGPVVVLLHGAGDQAGTWANLAPTLVRHYRVVAPDLAGHGGSDPPDGPLSLGGIVDGLEQVVSREAPGERFVLVGNSLGGWIALLYALRHPHAVAHLVLESSGGLRSESPHIDLLPRDRTHAQELLNRALGGAARPVPAFVLADMVREAPASPVARTMASDWERYLLDGRLPEIEAPVDLIWGERDGIVPLSHGQHMARQFRDARFHAVAGGGHLLHRDRATDFAKVLHQVLADRMVAHVAR